MLPDLTFLTAESEWRLAAVTGVACFLASIAVDLIFRVRAGRRLHRQSLRLTTAVNTMSEGLLMFDEQARLVLCNESYLAMYGLPGETVKPGCTLREIIEHRVRTGTLSAGDPGQYIADLRSAMAAGRTVNKTVALPDGRTIAVSSIPMAGGGWVATHRDCTDLKQREASFRLLFDGNPLPMWVYDNDSLRFLAVNDAAVDHYGYSREQFLSMTLLDIRPPEDHEAVRRVAGSGGGDYSTGRTWRHRKADGSEIEIAIFSRRLIYQGRPASLGAVVDLTERKQAEDELHGTREFLDTIVENVPALLIVKEAREHRYVVVNREAEKFFGVPRTNLIGKTAHEVFPRDQADLIARRDGEVLRSGLPMLVEENRIQLPGQGLRLVKSRRLAVRDTEGVPQYLLTVIEDVTERKRAEERIAHLAHHDALTDLPNRAAFVEHLAAAFDTAAEAEASFAVVCMDLDRFKEVNDVFGHSVGDALLREVSRRLREAAHGAFLARVGGDEFTAVAAQGAQPAGAVALAERLLATVADDIAIEDHSIRIGLSVGVAIFPTDAGDAATLLANADAALYRAKTDGRGTIRFFEADMDRRLRERRALQHDLRSALDNGEFRLHYQPLALIGGDIIGFEALLRWQHPSHGAVSPGTFIPLAEESGLIIAIGEWALREACREAASWPRNLQISVNLSPVQFRHGDLAGLVHSILLETGLGPRRLALEITEGVLIDDFSRAVAILRRLKAMGVRIAMDDFGAGYSSLSYLQSFPFDAIKIDRAFISNLHSNPQSAAIVRAVIGLARGLDVPVVAEGVETREQLGFLAREDCDEVQGYLIGRPAPIEQYAAVVGRVAEPAPLTARAS